MNRRPVFRLLLGAGVLLGLLLVAGLLLRPALAASGEQQEGVSLTIAKVADGDGTIGPGQTIRFQIVVTNTGEITATDVVVQDDYDQVALPTITVDSAAQVGIGAARNDGDVITWEIGDLAPGETWIASYEAIAAEAFAAGTIEVSNRTSVLAEGIEIANATVVLTVRAPHLTLTVQREVVGEEEGEISPGDTLRYTIRYGNNGGLAATNVVLEATYDETVVQEVSSITADGRRDGGKVRWELGEVAAGASGEVSFEVTLKPALSRGTIEVRSQATVRADGVEPTSVVDSFTMRTPLLSIAREREDVNGGAIEPGDTLRFTIRFKNSGAVAASNVVVRDDFDEGVVVGVSDISGGGREVDGAVVWELEEELEPGAERAVSYRVRLISEIGERTEVVNVATISIEGVEVGRAQTRMTIEPAEKEAASTTPQVFTEQPLMVAILVGVSAVTALAVIGGLVFAILRKGEWKERYFRLALEGVVVVIIVEAVLVLAMNRSIEPDGAVTILSGIAGYLLGRTVGEGGAGG